MKKLFEELRNAGYPAEWNEDETEVEMYLADADFYIAKSAGGYYSIEKVPYFADKEFYFTDTVENVFDVIEK